MDLDRRRRLWRWSIFLPRRLQFDEQLPALRGYEATVGKGIDDTFNAPDVTLLVEMPRRQCWPSLRQPPRKSCWRLSVLSEQPTAIAAAGVRSHCSGMGGHTKVLCAARPCLFRRLRTHPKGLRVSALPTPVPKPRCCFHPFQDSDHCLVKQSWQSQKCRGRTQRVPSWAG